MLLEAAPQIARAVRSRPRPYPGALVVVEGIDSSGAVRDLTREVQCQAVPADVVEVQPGGVLAPLGEGTAQLLFVHSSGLRADAQVRVEAMVHPPEIDFRQQIVPIFTRMGCNAGGCHGKSSGQNGFKLSLLGFYPEEDYEHLVKEARGRRLFPGAPQRSMLLRKAANLVPHGGGQRLEADSPEFRLLYRWIAQGMPYGPENAPQLARIEVLPDKRSMQRASEQQLVVLAWYADGHAEDVTHLAQYEPNYPDLAEVSERGLPLLHARDKRTGEILASIELPIPGQYGMMTYLHEGRQYVVVQAGSAKRGQPGSLVALRLP